MILSGEALVEFRSSERRCVWRVSQVYKQLTLIGVKTQSSYKLSSILHIDSRTRTGSNCMACARLP